MSTPTAVTNILKWQADHQGDIVYSQGDPHRLSSDSAHLLSPTDCSGLIAKLMEHFADTYVGTYTGNECTHGTLVTTSKNAARSEYGMLPGDCILFDWHGGPWDHIAMYAGNGRIWNHGGPDRGPQNWNLASNVDSAVEIMVRRFIPWPSGTVTHPAVHSGSPANPMHGKSIPSLIARGTGDYYGSESGPNESHGGYYASEKPAVKLIQEFLNWKYQAGIEVDGTFGPVCDEFVSKFQHEYMPGTQFYGQVWFDDWAKMASL